jgi:hypothetical protein
MNTAIRSDLPEYINFLKNVYGAIEMHTKEGSISVPLRYTIKETIKILDKSTPTRKSLQGWSWKKNDVLIREGTEVDHIMIKDWLIANGSIYTPTHIFYDLLDKWWNLDQASILMAYKKNVLDDIWLIREREDDLSGVISFAFDTAEKLDEIREGMFDWQIKAGYTSSSFFVGKAHTERDVVKSLESIGWKKEKDHVFPSGEQTEYRLNIKGYKK